MKRVTKSNLLRLVALKKQCIQEENDTGTLKMINEFIENVINKDKKYYHKLSSYNSDEEILRYLL